jgi:tetratricopeptide (TPR) repeat protein
MMKSLFYLPFVLCAGMSATAQQDSALYYFRKGNEEKEARRWMLAAKHYDKAIQFNAKFTEAYLQNGYAHLEMRRTDVAKAHFTKVYELEPGNATAIKELTDLYYGYRQYEKAIEFAQKCSSCPNAQRIIGQSHYELEDYAAAVKTLLGVVAKNPADAEAQYTIGRSYLEMEEYKSAIPYYAKAVELDKTRNAWMYELGLQYYNMNDFKNALDMFNKAAENGYPKSNDFYENLGYCQIYTGDFEKGEKTLLDIYAKKPGNKDILRDIAEIYYQRKMYDKSLDFCQKLLEMDKNDGKALYQAGLCFQKKGQTDRGQQMCDKAIEMDPSLASLRQKKMSAGL